MTDDRLMEGGSPAAAAASTAVLAALFPFALLGTLLYYVPYQLPKLATAIAKGDVDVVSTYKLGLGLAAFPIWLVLLLALSFLLLPAPYSFAAMGLSVASPLAALPWLDRIDRSRLKRRPRGVRAGEIPTRAALVEARREATQAIARAREIVEALPA